MLDMLRTMPVFLGEFEGRNEQAPVYTIMLCLYLMTAIIHSSKTYDSKLDSLNQYQIQSECQNVANLFPRLLNNSVMIGKTLNVTMTYDERTRLKAQWNSIRAELYKMVTGFITKTARSRNCCTSLPHIEKEQHQDVTTIYHNQSSQCSSPPTTILTGQHFRVSWSCEACSGYWPTCHPTRSEQTNTSKV